MAQQQVTAYVFMELDWPRSADGAIHWGEPRAWVPKAWSARVDDNDSRVFISEQTVAVEVPDNFDPTAKQIAAIEREKLEALKAYQRAVASCNERLSKLQALEAA